MARREAQKLKLLHIRDMLFSRSDEAHPLNTQDIVDSLSALGIEAERKSILRDIDTLRTYGEDISAVKGRNGGFCMGSRLFELAELKLLVDSVQASKFITEKKTYALIKKLSSLASVYEARSLSRQIFISNRDKSVNETIYYAVDTIHTAIAENRRIAFRYFEYTTDKKKRYRHGGAKYDVSPYILLWDDENYYLIAYDAAAGIIKHYRVDKMDAIELLPEERLGREVFKTVDMSSYNKRTFSMYGGKEERVTIEFEDALIGVALDRFGKDIFTDRRHDGHFQVTVGVAVSPQFFAWVTGLGSGAEIISPKSVREGMKAHLESSLEKYYKK